MESPLLLLLRGVQGAGKTTLANTLIYLKGESESDAQAFAADDYFYQADGSYLFNPDKLNRAHKECFMKVETAMQDRTSLVVVHNTFSRAAELTPYYKLGETYGYRVATVVVENRHGNIDSHGVPLEVREEFSRRIKSNIKLI